MKKKYQSCSSTQYRLFHAFCCLKTGNRGPDLSVDFAAAIVEVQEMTVVPVMMVEGKRIVGGTLNRIDSTHLGQLLLQSYYAMKTYEVYEMIYILSDGRTWHMFKLLFIKKKPLSPLTPLMEVEWYNCCTTQNRDGLVKILVGALDVRSETAPSETAQKRLHQVSMHTCTCACMSMCIMTLLFCDMLPSDKKNGGKENGLKRRRMGGGKNKGGRRSDKLSWAVFSPHSCEH